MDTILITGGTGIVGKHLRQIIPDAYYIGSKDVDLTNLQEVDKYLSNLMPNIIVHLAAKVGGILDNIKHPVDFYETNTLMNTHILKCAHKYNTKHVISIASTCAYPDICKSYPITEDMLHLGAPPETNLSYAYSKRSMAVQVDAYRQQYKKEWCVVFPCNLYSEHEVYNSEKSHFLISFINRVIESKYKNEKEIVLWGSGKPLRQFMYAKDLAKAIKLMIDYKIYKDFNIATAENLSINEIAKITLSACNAEHIKIVNDLSKPDGQYRKDVSSQKFLSIFPSFEFTPLCEGIKEVYLNLKRTK